VKFYRAGVAAGVLAAALAMAACSSSGGGSSSSSSAGGGSTAAGATSSGSASSGSGDCTGAGNLTSDGSTAQQNAVNAWIKGFQSACGKTVVYSGGGSGQGVTDFTAGKVNFAGSDAALNADKGEVTAANTACGSPALDIPMVTGPIAVAFKVKGVSSLTLTPSTIAKIFTGKIKKWNDAEIAGENKGVTLPSENITVFYRQDQSGTTQNFETYLNTAAASDYTATPSKTWVGTGQGKNGSQGVQQALTSTEGGIGYIEWSYTGGLTTAKVDNGAGGVALTADSAGKAVAAAQPAPNSNAGDLSLKLDYATKTAGAYPIILVTYEIVCSKYKDPTVGAAVKAFLTYTSSSAGQAMLTKVGSAPLPSSILTQVQAAVAKIS
jgi:phosphate transport system substrate-binding protein